MILPKSDRQRIVHLHADPDAGHNRILANLRLDQLQNAGSDSLMAEGWPQHQEGDERRIALSAEILWYEIQNARDRPARQIDAAELAALGLGRAQISADHFRRRLGHRAERQEILAIRIYGQQVSAAFFPGGPDYLITTLDFHLPIPGILIYGRNISYSDTGFRFNRISA
jgi:hypothetical protein